LDSGCSSKSDINDEQQTSIAITNIAEKKSWKMKLFHMLNTLIYTERKPYCLPSNGIWKPGLSVGTKQLKRYLGIPWKRLWGMSTNGTKTYVKDNLGS